MTRVACAPAGSVLRFGFYAHFWPVSYSADQHPASPGFDDHRGYEADLLTALEAMEGANLSFTPARHSGLGRHLAASVRVRVRHRGGAASRYWNRAPAMRAVGSAIVFTAGHIGFRQSLLVRAADAERLARHHDLTGADRVGVLAGTTGEARLLELTGIAAAGRGAGRRHARGNGRRGWWSRTAVPITSSVRPARHRGLGDRRRLQPVDEGRPRVGLLRRRSGDARCARRRRDRRDRPWGGGQPGRRGDP